jgi:precorrin-6B methylase 2
MTNRTEAVLHANTSPPLLRRVVAIVRKRYGLRETDRLARKVSRSLRTRGLLGTARLCTAVFFKPSLRKSAIRPAVKSPSDFDLRFGVDTSAWLDVTDLDIEEHLRTNTVGYQPTPPELLRETIDALNICHDQFTFVDIGCGKGLTLLAASEYPFRKIIGVEFSPTLSRIARQNASKFLQHFQSRPDIEVVSSDARQYRLPEGPLVLFMYNPFTGDSMKGMVEKLAADRKARPRDIYVIYVAAVEKRFFRSFSLLKNSFLQIPPGTPSGPSGFASDYRIYKV